MADFKNTRWANQEFVKQYRENADIYIVERQRMFGIMQSFFSHYLAKRKNIRILDLGCGDGIVTRNILDVDSSISATLVDASGDMLQKAKERLKGVKNVDYITLKRVFSRSWSAACLKGAMILLSLQWQYIT